MKKSIFGLILLSCVAAGLGAGCGPATPADAVRQSEEGVQAAAQAYKAGDLRAGRGFLEAAVRAQGGNSDAYSAVSKRLAEQGHVTEAANFAEQALKRTNLAQDPALWATLADLAAKVGNHSRSREADREAAQRADQILQQIRAATKEEPSFVTRLLQAGFYYHEQNNIPSALTALREAHRRAPDNVLALNNLGFVLADGGSSENEFQEAVQLTREAVRRSPDVFFILDSYGWALFKAGQVQEARRVLREAVDAAPGEPEVRYHLAMVYIRLELVREARAELDRALYLRPGYPQAQQAKEALMPATDRETSPGPQPQNR